MRLVLLTLLSLLLLVPGLMQPSAAAPTTLEVGDRAPDFETSNLEGALVHLADLRGQWVLLNFWATWCRPCVQEFPSMQRLSEQMTDLPFHIVALNVMETPERIKAFLRRNPVTLTIWQDPEGEIQRRYGVYGFPTTVLVGPDGAVVAVQKGAKEWDAPERVAELRQLIVATNFTANLPTK